jgi:hypothetical protein
VHVFRSIRWVFTGLVVLVGLAVIYYNSILDWQERPCCHKGIMLSLKAWMDEKGMGANSNTNSFPNVRGASRDSLLAIREEMGGRMDWAENYRYVPGLCENDPGQLLLMYLDRPTRWIWHGQPRTVFKEKKWLVVPVDFGLGRPVQGELSERVSADEFKRRLRATIDFVRTNQRPNWQTVVAEHTKFLQSLEQVGR